MHAREMTMRSTRHPLRPDIPASRRWTALASLVALVLGVALALPTTAQSPVADAPPRIVVSYPVLGSVVRELVGDRATVEVLMGDGVDPHDWSPSARDVETIHQADLVVVNGLGLEEGLHDALEEAAAAGVPVFEATDHVALRALDDAPGHEAEDGHDTAHGPGGPGAVDPHFWVDPLSMRDVVLALGPVVAGLGVEITEREAALVSALTALDAEVRTMLEVVPPERRKLVTGHESMGYFADRYGFELVGAVVPGLSSLGEVSAGQLAAIATVIREHGVPAILTEVGTPQAVVDAIAAETGVTVIQLPSHALPADGSYRTFIRDIAAAIATALG